MDSVKNKMLVMCHLPVHFKSCVNDLGEMNDIHLTDKEKLEKRSGKNHISNYLGNK